MRNRQALILCVITTALLLLGLAVYLFDRLPNSAVLIPINDPNAHEVRDIFGSLGNYLPSFVHVYAFVLLSAVVVAPNKARLCLICSIWFSLEVCFELAQHPAAKSMMTVQSNSWACCQSLASALERYIFSGVFDALDLLAIFGGSFAAFFTVVITSLTEKQNEQRTFLEE